MKQREKNVNLLINLMKLFKKRVQYSQDINK